jgi:death-on-curing protein
LDIVFLTIEDVLEVHRELIERYGGAGGIRDAGLLDSALALPQAGSGDTYFHDFPAEMAAAYLFHIARNHPFVDGNKRTALAAALLFLELNGIPYKLTEDEAVEIVMGVAGSTIDKAELVRLLRSRIGTR